MDFREIVCEGGSGSVDLVRWRCSSFFGFRYRLLHLASLVLLIPATCHDVRPRGFESRLRNPVCRVLLQETKFPETNLSVITYECGTWLSTGTTLPLRVMT